MAVAGTTFASGAEADVAALQQQFRVISIPTVLVMKNGTLTAKNVGYASKEKLLSLL